MLQVLNTVWFGFFLFKTRLLYLNWKELSWLGELIPGQLWDFCVQRQNQVAMKMPMPNKLRTNSIWNLLRSLEKKTKQNEIGMGNLSNHLKRLSPLFFKHRSCPEPWRPAAEENIWIYTPMKGYPTDLNNHSTVDSIPYSVITFKCLGLLGVFLFYFSYLL